MAVGSCDSFIGTYSGAEGHLKERRRFARFAVELPAELEVLDAEPVQERHDIVTSDVSEAGAFFRTKVSIPKGARVQVRLVLLNDRVKELTGAQGCLTISGKVTRADSSGIGISFDENFLHDML
jgi:hypothetical protein